MAVITELIQAGLSLKRGGNLGGAIEHFKQLHATYPAHARIMFELAACWRAFGVPEQALPIYRELLAMPKAQGLPPKDMPRLYTQLGATLLELGDSAESLAIIEDGLRLHPSYRSLRAWRIFALTQAGESNVALLDALELMLESLAPSRWDIFETEIKAVVKAMRASLPAESAIPESDIAESKSTKQVAEPTDTSVERESADSAVSQDAQIDVTSDAPNATETDVPVNLVKPPRKKLSRRKKSSRPQLGKKAVRIDISGESDAPAKKRDGDDAAAAAGALKIPIDPD